jgi:integrase/recombinase XerD
MKKLTLNTVYEKFLLEKTAKNLTPETLFHYERAHKLLNDHMIENELKYFTRLTSDDWLQFMRRLNDGRRLPVTVNTYLRGARAIVLFSKAKYGAPDFAPTLMNAAQNVKDVYSDAQLAALIKEPEPGDRSFSEIRAWAMTCLLLYSSLRIKSIINIHIEDIDFHAMELTVRQLKNKKISILPLIDEMLAAFEKYLAARGNYIAELGAADNGYLFVNNAGGKMTRHQLYSTHKYYNRRRGVEKKGIHIFRNTFAKLMVRAGCDAFTLQRWMCHADLKSTKLYIELFSRDLFMTVRKYSPLLQIRDMQDLKK